MNTVNFIFDRIFYPKVCVGCGRIGKYLCADCVGAITQTDLVCPECERRAFGGATHPLCKRKLGMDGLWSLGIYKNPLKKAIQKLKYRYVREMAEELLDITLEYWAKYQPQILEEIKKDRGENWVVVPVPLHPKRENWRGFNQSALLGKKLAEKMGLDYAEPLKRIKNTTPQAKLTGFYRQSNIKNAFILPSTSRPLPSNILLIDDVWTTGSTLKECAKVLKRAGAGKVWALTIAR